MLNGLTTLYIDSFWTDYYSFKNLSGWAQLPRQVYLTGEAGLPDLLGRQIITAKPIGRQALRLSVFARDSFLFENLAAGHPFYKSTVSQD